MESCFWGLISFCAFCAFLWPMFSICGICNLWILTLLLHHLLCECESSNRRGMRLNSAMDRSRARQPLAGSFHCRRTAAGIAACCARRPECKDVFHETELLPAIHRFAVAATRAIGPRDLDRRCKPRRRIRSGRTYRFDP